RLVHGDAKKPGLKPAFALEGIEVFDDGQKNFLANLLAVFAGKIRRKLENKPPRRRVIQIEEFVPRFSFTATAASKQFGFDCHVSRTLFEAAPLEQISSGSILHGIPS